MAGLEGEAVVAGDSPRDGLDDPGRHVDDRPTAAADQVAVVVVGWYTVGPCPTWRWTTIPASLSRSSAR